MKKKHHHDTRMVNRRRSTTKRNPLSKKKLKSKTSARRKASQLSKNINKYLKTLKSGGGRLEAWQDKFPAAGTSAWKSDNNICKYPNLQKSTFNPPGQRGGKSKRKRNGGEYHIDESYFGRKPIGYTGPHPSPYPSLKAWKPYSAEMS